MKKYYAIAIGGSGARCVEALVHLCAAGMLPDIELKVMFVDPDKSNGNVDRAQKTIDSYYECRGVMGIGNGLESELFSAKITKAESGIWSPVTAGGGDNNDTLNGIFEYNTLNYQGDSHLKDLFEVLFSSAERKTKLEKGFRGHPSIGAAVMANAMEMKSEEPWHSFFIELLRDVIEGLEARIFLFGSIFGGTGAAGLPTIPKIIKEKIRNAQSNNEPKVQLGAAMLLPYFSFPPSKDNESEKELQARCEHFLVNTQAALNYYHKQSKYDDTYNSMYFIGEQNPVQTSKEFSLGANGQKNDPHFVEILAALAAIDFFTKEQSTAQAARSYYFTARQEKDRVRWADIPDGHGGELLREKIGRLLKFSMMYLYYYFPQLMEIAQQGKSREAYYIEFFKRRKVSLDGATQTRLENIKEYSECFKKWLAVSLSGSSDPTYDLINLNLSEQSIGQELDSLNTIVVPPNGLDYLPKSSPAKAEDIKKALAEKSPKGNKGTPIGEFILALYDSCA